MFEGGNAQLDEEDEVVLQDTTDEESFENALVGLHVLQVSTSLLTSISGVLSFICLLVFFTRGYSVSKCLSPK